MTTPSPYLPHTSIQLAWDSTSLGALKRCARYYAYTNLNGWAEKDQSVHLRFGIEYHTTLQEYDIARAAGFPHEACLRSVIKDLLKRTGDFESDHVGKNRHTLVRTCIYYLDDFKNDPAKTYILKSGQPAVELSFKFQLPYGPKSAPSEHYWLCGHLDRVVEFNGDLYVMDRKTSTFALTSRYFNQYEPDNQMSLYTLASQVVIESPVRGVIIDAAQVTERDSVFQREMTYRTKDQIEEWLADLHYWLDIAESMASDSRWPMNDTACDKYGGCRFRQICCKDPRVREQFLSGNFNQLEVDERWNPLRTR